MLAAKPTNNPEAYDAYLRGLAFEARSHYPFNRDLLSKAIGFYERAVQLDPHFVIAWARLSLSHAFLSFSRDEPTHGTEGEAANHALKNAQKLEPNSPETLLSPRLLPVPWRGRITALAKMTFERVIKMLPASSEVLQALGRIAQREGHWDQSVAYHEKAIALDPSNVQLLMDASWTYCMLRQFPAALKLLDDQSPGHHAKQSRFDGRSKPAFIRRRVTCEQAARLLPANKRADSR